MPRRKHESLRLIAFRFHHSEACGNFVLAGEVLVGHAVDDVFRGDLVIDRPLAARRGRGEEGPANRHEVDAFGLFQPATDLGPDPGLRLGPERSDARSCRVVESGQDILFLEPPVLLQVLDA